MAFRIKILNAENSLDLQLLNTFITSAGSSLKSFRYFNSRPFSVIKNHLHTILVLNEGIPVAYGHLDREKEITWLGIAVTEMETGKGLGKLVMDNLLSEAMQKNYTDIYLSVDKSNSDAIALYTKYEFKIEEVLSHGVYLMKYNIKNIEEK